VNITGVLETTAAQMKEHFETHAEAEPGRGQEADKGDPEGLG
jgi:hypothetical protein